MVEVLLTVLCRLVCRISRLRVLEADWVVQIIHGVIGHGVLIRVRVEG